MEWKRLYIGHIQPLEVVQHSGLTDQIERMKAFTPAQAKRGLEEGKESEGKKPKEVEESAEDTHMEDADQNSSNDYTQGSIVSPRWKSIGNRTYP